MSDALDRDALNAIVERALPELLRQAQVHALGWRVRYDEAVDPDADVAAEVSVNVTTRTASIRVQADHFASEGDVRAALCHEVVHILLAPLLVPHEAIVSSLEAPASGIAERLLEAALEESVENVVKVLLNPR